MTTAEHTLPEPHTSDVGSRLNWLRAGVLGANDGIVSTAGLVIGVAAAGTSTSALAAAGIAALAAGAVTGRAKSPIVLVGSNSVTSDVKKLASGKQITTLGGSSTVSDKIVDELK